MTMGRWHLRKNESHTESPKNLKYDCFIIFGLNNDVLYLLTIEGYVDAAKFCIVPDH